MTELRATATGTAIVAVLVGVATALIGLPPARGLLLVAAVMAAGAARVLAVVHGPARARDDWPRRAAGKADGTRREVRGLSWSLSGDRRTVTPMAARRVRALATTRLARHGVELADPAHAASAARLLGGEVHRILVADPAEPMRERELVACVDALERLPDPRRRDGHVAPPVRDPEPHR